MILTADAAGTADLRAVTNRCIASCSGRRRKDPDDRFQIADEMAEQLPASCARSSPPTTNTPHSADSALFGGDVLMDVDSYEGKNLEPDYHTLPVLKMDALDPPRT